MVTWLYNCVKGLLSASTYAGFCRMVEPFHIPLWRQFLAWLVSRFSLFTSDLFSPPHIWVSCRRSLFGSSFCLFIYGRASLALERKSVVPMEKTFMDTEDEYKKYGTLRSLRYIYSNPFRFPISSLGSPNFSSQKSWEEVLAKYTAGAWTLTRQNPEL